MPLAFIGGATGYTGRAVVPVLRSAGWEVVAHVRPDSGRLDAFREEFGGVGAAVDTTGRESSGLARGAVFPKRCTGMQKGGK